MGCDRARPDLAGSGHPAHLHDEQPPWVLNDIALSHLQKQGMKEALVERLRTTPFAGDDWAAYLDRHGLCDERHRRIAVNLPPRSTTRKTLIGLRDAARAETK